MKAGKGRKDRVKSRTERGTNLCFKRIGNLFRGFIGLFISGLERDNPEALLEVEKENLRTQIAQYNQGLALHAGLCEKLMSQVRKLEGEEKELRARTAANLRVGNKDAAKQYALRLSTVTRELEENRSQAGQAEKTYNELIRARDVSIKAAQAKIQSLSSGLNDLKIQKATASLSEMASGMISKIGGSGDTLDRLQNMVEEERTKAAGKARVARDSLNMNDIALKESEQETLADQALADFAAKEGIVLEPEPESIPFQRATTTRERVRVAVERWDLKPIEDVQLNFDLHCHSRFSADGVAQPEALVAEARVKGLHGFAITDHDTSECVDYFEKHGFLSPDGLPVKQILIIPGQEITTAEGHLLALGVKLPPMKGISAAEAIEIIHAQGGLAIPPHPYDFFRAGIREPSLDKLAIDGLEVFNAATTLRRYNQQAFDYATQRGLPMTSSSDAHDHCALGTAYSILDADEFSLAGVLAAIKKGPKLKQRYLTPGNALKKTWNNVFRLRRKRPQAV